MNNGQGDYQGGYPPQQPQGGYYAQPQGGYYPQQPQGGYYAQPQGGYYPEQQPQGNYTFCDNCGARINEGYMFCANCGKSFAPGPTEEEILEENRRQQYAYAESLLEAQQYDDAKSAFDALGDYRDAVEKSSLCVAKKEEAYNESIYNNAVSVLSKEYAVESDYIAAIEALRPISGFRDTEARIAEIEGARVAFVEAKAAAEEQDRRNRYDSAMQNYRSGAFDMAIYMFGFLGDYSNSREMVDMCNQAKEYQRKKGEYNQAISVLNAKNVGENHFKYSLSILSNLGDFEDSRQRYAEIDARYAEWLEAKRIEEEYRKKKLAEEKKRRKKKATIFLVVSLFVIFAIAAAIFAYTPFKINYNLDGGIVAQQNKSSYTFMTKSFYLSNPTREGYTFAGWTAKDGQTPSTNVKVKLYSYGDKTYTAHWTANSYNVTYNAAGGSVTPNAQTVTYDSDVTLPVPTREGYTFAGWYYGDQRFTDGIWKNAGDIKLTAKWTANSYMITYQDCYDFADVSQYRPGYVAFQSVTFDKEEALYVPTRTGYSFNGWYDGDTEISSGAWTIASDVTLVSKWIANGNTITLDANGGSISTNYLAVTYDQSYTLPTPTRTGYTFDGWYNGSTKYTDGTWQGVSDITLTAKWTAVTYTIIYSDIKSVTNTVKVTFNPNYSGGTATVKHLSNGEKLTYPTIPTRSGYMFAGWYTNSSCTREYSFSETITSDLTLYAKWVSTSNNAISPNSSNSVYLNSYSTYYSFVALQTGKVTISIGKGGWLYCSTTSTSGYDSITINCTKGSTYIFATESYLCLSDSQYIGYTTLSLSSTLPSSTATASCNSVAGYIYNSSSSILQSVQYGDTVTLYTPTREGYTFDGWYYGDTKVESGKWNYDTNVTLTARWK